MSTKTSIKLTELEVQKLVEAGGKAPSGGNVQPWRVKIKGNTLELMLDERRSTSFIDVGRYASFFALGCFLKNLQITADYLGLQYKTRISEYKNILDPLVKVLFTGRGKQKDNGLYAYIDKRVSNRKLHDGTMISPSEIEKLKELVHGFNPNYRLHALSSNLDRSKVADILGVADAIRIVNDEMYYQMISEFRWSEKETLDTHDGMDLDTLELPKSARKQLMFLKRAPFIRKILPRKAFEETAKPMIKECSHICCLSLNSTLNSTSMLLGGEILEQIWLIMTQRGFYLHPWSILPFMLIRVEKFNGDGFNKEEQNEINQIKLDFYKVFNLSEKELPIFIFRLFKGDAPSAKSLRIKWRDFTKID